MPKRLSPEEFVHRAKLVHGSEYDYSDTYYQNMQTKVSIRCFRHGVFQQLPQAHLKGQGCPVCGAEKQRQTMLSRYGVDNPMKVKSIVEKARRTCVARYGTEWAMSTSEVQEKVMATNQERYGVDRPVQSDAIKARIAETFRQKYGVSYLGQIPGVRDKAHETCLMRYGSEEPLASSVVRKKIETTNWSKYGGPAPLSSKEIRRKVRDTVREKYGVDYVVQSDNVVRKTRETKAERHTFHTSFGEDALYDKLCQRFGSQDIVRQYSSDVYPFACDFYIKSRDLYLELNGSWTHGTGWFEGSDSDEDTVALWAKRGTRYYQNAIHVWTSADVQKRAAARAAVLNYVVFWDSKLRDADLWFALGCPDGRDWDKMYSWISERIMVLPEHIQHLSGTPSNFSAVAKSYQFSVFYGRELLLWQENKQFRGLPLQVWLYANRLQYLGKAPDMLTTAELMRGFTVAGVMKGYTVFDTSLMNDFVKKYQISSVYDPCAGWGERMLYCFYHGINYEGVDVNEALKPGYDSMIQDFGMVYQTIQFADSGVYQPVKHADAVVTCPPYGNIERYSEYGAENLSESDFLTWWQQVVKHSLMAGVTWFAFQINQKWRDRMLNVVEQNGFCFVEELIPRFVRSGHFNRPAGSNQKREFESMLVCRR